MNFDKTTIFIIIVILVIIWNFFLCDGNSNTKEKFELNDRNKYINNDFSQLLIPSNMINNDTNDTMLTTELKFPPKRSTLLNISNNNINNIDDLHEPRNTGYSPKFHGKKTIQYFPALPNVSDDFNTIREIPKEFLTYNDDYPLLEMNDLVLNNFIF